MKSKMKLSGQLRSYLRWPLILSILMLVMNIGMYFVDVMAGMWFTLFFAVYVIAAAVLYYRQRPQVINELITFATEYGQVQKHLIQELALPYAVMDSQGKLLWVNKEFTKIIGKNPGPVPISRIFISSFFFSGNCSSNTCSHASLWLPVSSFSLTSEYPSARVPQ